MPYKDPHKHLKVSRRWKTKNQERVRKYQAEYEAANQERRREYRSANRDRWHELNRVWSAKNRNRCNVVQARRRARKLSATPAWADQALIADMYLEAAYQGMAVDHIVPLQGRNVCGLHWEGNLQLLTKAANSAKGNRFP